MTSCCGQWRHASDAKYDAIARSGSILLVRSMSSAFPIISWIATKRPAIWIPMADQTDYTLLCDIIAFCDLIGRAQILALVHKLYANIILFLSPSPDINGGWFWVRAYTYVPTDKRTTLWGEPCALRCKQCMCNSYGNNQQQAIYKLLHSRTAANTVPCFNRCSLSSAASALCCCSRSLVHSVACKIVAGRLIKNLQGECTRNLLLYMDFWSSKKCDGHGSKYNVTTCFYVFSYIPKSFEIFNGNFLYSSLFLF